MGAIIAHHGLLLGGGTPVTPVTWNPADKASLITLSGGNLIAARTGADGYNSVRATTSRATSGGGKYYFECLVSGGAAAPGLMVGIAPPTDSLTAFVGTGTTAYGYNSDNGQKYTSGANSTYGSTYANGDVIGVALDFALRRIYFAKNNIWQNSGDPTTDTNYAFSIAAGTYFPMISLYYGAGAQTLVGRFKSSDFSYSPPSGYSSWQ
jgi:hypothetical protein